MKRLFPLLFLLYMTGCAKYEFDLIWPENLRARIGRKDDSIVRREPLEYHLLAYEGRLVMRIYNPSPDPIQLLGAQCSIVDPEGQSHPLPSQTIAPESFIKLILPPPRPTVERTGPSVGFGATYTRGYPYRREFGYTDFYDEPRYYSVYDPSNQLYWDWIGETDIRMTLVYERAGKTFRDEFAFHRVKVG